MKSPYYIVSVMLVVIIALLAICGIVNKNNPGYASTVPEKFLRSADNDIIDSNFITVSSCDGKESFRIPVNIIEYRRPIGKIYIVEKFTDREYVFDDKEYQAIIDHNGISQTIFGCPIEEKLFKLVKEKEEAVAKAQLEAEIAQAKLREYTERE